MVGNPGLSLVWPMQARLSLLSLLLRGEFMSLILQVSPPVLSPPESLLWFHLCLQQMWGVLLNTLIILSPLLRRHRTQVLALPRSTLSPSRSLLATLCSASLLATWERWCPHWGCMWESREVTEVVVGMCLLACYLQWICIFRVQQSSFTHTHAHLHTLLS